MWVWFWVSRWRSNLNVSSCNVSSVNNVSEYKFVRMGFALLCQLDVLWRVSDLIVVGKHSALIGWMSILTIKCHSDCLLQDERTFFRSHYFNAINVMSSRISGSRGFKFKFPFLNGNLNLKTARALNSLNFHFLNGNLNLKTH